MRQLLIIMSLLSMVHAMAQFNRPIANLRYEDNWAYLKSDTIKKTGTEKLKFIPVGKRSTVSFGGEIREWYEIRGNVNFGDLPPGVVPDIDGAILHRAMFHTDFWMGDQFRVFGQLNNTWLIGSKNPPIPEISQDGIGIHQIFTEVHFTTGDKQFFTRLGRQEFNFGNELQISSREGPNNRQPFDGASLVYKQSDFSMHGFWATPVIINTGAFDNTRIKEYIWGVYGQFAQNKAIRFDAFAFGFESERRVFNLEPGNQIRGILGGRAYYYGKNWRVDMTNTYQFGKFNDLTISAYNFTGSASYTFNHPMLFSIGLAGSYITGDRSPNDNKLNTYDALYPMPTFGLALPQGPSNITNIRPILGLMPVKGMMVFTSVYFLARQSIHDGSYTPSMDYVRPFPPYESSAKAFGTQYALDIFYSINTHWNLVSMNSIVTPGEYALDTGLGKITYFTSLSLGYKF